MKKQGSGNRDQGDQGSGLAVILFAALVAITPLLRHGPSCGHDFDFHLVSWLDCVSSWRHGILYPHWTANANYGAGEPRFVFYSPLTWMLGAALGLVLPWTLVPIALTYLLLAGTGLATRALARQALTEGAATLAGCVAFFSGYALFTAYERTAFAELAGGIWIPLVLLYALRERGFIRGEEGVMHSHPFHNGREMDGAPRNERAPADTFWRLGQYGTIPLALAVAGAWLSNPTVGVMACYLLAAVALTAGLMARSWRPVLRTTAGVTLGIALVAVYLVPAAWEQRWVDIHQVTEDPGQTLENNWLFARHADPLLALHDEVLHTASIIAVLMIGLALAGLLACWLRGRLPAEQSWWVPLAIIPIAVLLLQFSFSRPLWNLLPDLRFLQFPWRWLGVLEAPMAIFVAAALWPRRSNWRRVGVAATCGAVFLAMTAYAGSTFFQGCDDQDSVAGMLATYRAGHGFSGTGEYEPIGADNYLLASGLPDACLVSDPATVLGVVPPSVDPDDTIPVWSAAQGSCLATYGWQPGSPEHKRLTADVSRAGFLVLRLRAFPAWRLRLNDGPVASLPLRGDGLMIVQVQKGKVDLTVDWTTTADVIVGRWLSALAVLALTGLWLLERKRALPRLS
ncbi:MAG: 6-pyruvoyl-tetrahydropterin synthase-related protein [Terracidiphilus sp.]|jgi:hypothetical protein